MAREEEIVIPWDPSGIEAALEQASRPPAEGTLADLVRLFEAYSRNNATPSLYATLDNIRFWRLAHAMFPNKVAAPPPWVSGELPQIFIEKLNADLDRATSVIEAELPRIRFSAQRSITLDATSGYSVAPANPTAAHEDPPVYRADSPRTEMVSAPLAADQTEARLSDALSVAAREPGNLVLIDQVIDTLRDAAPTDSWTHACVRVAEDLQITDPDRRSAMAKGLLRIARALERQGPREVAWSALTTWQSLIPIHELAAIHEFIVPGTHSDTIQVAMRCIWNCASVEPELPELPILAARCRELVDKYLDPDWITVPRTRALVVDALLASSVLLPEVELAPRIAQARQLGRAFPWRIFRSSIERMVAHAANLAHPTPRASLLESLTRSSDE